MLNVCSLAWRSEAIPGANPSVINSPQNPPFGLRTERISGSSFTAPRDQSLQTWLYRAETSLNHSEFTPFDVPTNPEAANPPPPQHVSPNSYVWPTFPVPKSADWISGQRLLARNGDPQQKRGLAVWLFSLTADIPARTVFASLDGEALLIPQAGALDVQTELGRLVVRQNEIAVIPRGVRYRVLLPEGTPCRGYVCELFEGHFRLPVLGAIGSTGLANARDFQVPTAHFDGTLVDGVAKTSGEQDEWRVVARLNGRLWSCTQPHTPFDVAGWHGTCYPYKYDLARFCVLGNVLFDEHDPSLYVLLTASAHGSAPGTAVADFAIIPPRWVTAEGTLWLPYDHRNTMQELYGPIVNNQDAAFPLNGRTHEFRPFGAGLNGAMAAHGATDEEMRRARAVDTSRPAKLQGDGVTLFLLETERPLYVSNWGVQCAQRNTRVKPTGAAKM